MEKEEWRVIKEHPRYEVSNLGNVRNGLNKGKLTPQISNRGYLRVSISINGKGKHRSVHRLVAIAFIPNPNNKSQVNHIDGNTHNNTVANLEWCTGSDNIKHAYETRLRQDNNFVTVYDQDKNKTLEFRSVHQAAAHLNISDEAISVWKVRSEYAPIDGRYIIKEINVRKPKDSTPLYVYDHVEDIYADYANRTDFVLNTGLSPYTVLERLRKYKQLSHYIAGYTVSEKELKDVERKKSGLEDRMKLFSKPVVKAKMGISVRLEDGTIVNYETMNKLIEKYPYLTSSEIGTTLSHGKTKGVTRLARGINMKYTDLDIPFTLYNKYEIENSEEGLRYDIPRYKLTYDDDILLIRTPAALGKILNSPKTAIVQKYKKGRVVKLKDGSGKNVVVERVC